jgi:UDP-N-acetylmuramoyl-L-alanyl-D-glutamate--2,6-diaminopimelate ligase
MRLAELLEGVQVVKLFSLMFGKMVLTQDVTIRAVQYDSRKVERGDLFIAIRGTASDGHTFIDSAVSRGAAVVVVEDDTAMPDAYFMHNGVLKIVVADSRKALARIAANFYVHPSHHLMLIGVTGTNGKTTTTHLIRSMLEAHGSTVGLIGTIEYRINREVFPATHTTPESLELNQLLALMVERGCSAAVMEVSSHSLSMSRVYGLKFQAAVFTNLTQDHLDFHGTMDAYFGAKKILFDALAADAFAVTNADDPSGMRMVGDTQAQVLSYGLQGPASVRAKDVAMNVRGIALTVVHDGRSCSVRSPLSGRFNVENILATYATGVALGIVDETIATGIAGVHAVRGRFEQITSPRGWTAIVDYAHTPDALAHCLQTIRDILPQRGGARILTVFGCGGNRDRGKRPIMGRIASEMSDLTIVTSDNPRKEDPDAIIDEIMRGIVSDRNVRREADRRTAIRAALSEAQPGDVVLIAGKGHEDYQVIGEVKSHFDDREEVERFVRETS